MKIAFCFCGQVRSAEYAADGILNFIGDLLPDVDFFMHTWDTNGYKKRGPKSIKVKELCEQRNYDINDVKLIDKEILSANVAPDTFSVLKTIQQQYNNQFKLIEVESLTGHYKNFCEKYTKFPPHLYSWYKVINAKKQHELIYQFEYDVVIKTRTDLVYPRGSKLIDEIENWSKNKDHFYAVIPGPQRIHDVFHIASSKVMDTASEFVINSPEKKQYASIFYDYLTYANLPTSPTVLKRYAVYRPETFPSSSLNFEECFNKEKDWYASASDTYRLPEQE